MNKLRSFLASMAGRIFLVLVIALLLFSALALALGAAKRRVDVHRFDMEMTIERVYDFVSVQNGVAARRTHRDIWVTPGTKMAEESDRATALDPEMTALLVQRLGDSASDVRAYTTAVSTCVPPQAQHDASMEPKCWLVSLKLRDARAIRIAVNTPLHLMIFASTGMMDPLYLTILAGGFAVVAFFVARMAAAPLDKLSSAAQGLSNDLDSPPLAEDGPREVRDAARAFNAMQERLRRTMSERMQMLAAITHDLQTPLTRLRLRLEKVENKELRERLIADLAATRKLVNEGLELARSSNGPNEPAVLLDLDSLLASLIEDEVDAGRHVQLLYGCGCDVLARPQSLRRCLANLIDNALKYAGSATVAAECNADEVDIHVLDNGPGLPPDQLEQVFEPFVRIETSRSRETGGTGLGLTIARSLAHQNGGRLCIKNRSSGGLDVILSLPIAGTHELAAPIDDIYSHIAVSR